MNRRGIGWLAGGLFCALIAFASAQNVVTFPPSFANLSGSLACSQMPALTGDVSSSAGACATALGNIPNDTAMAGDVLGTNTAAPSSPSAGQVRFWTDSTALRFHDKNASGVIGTTVVADTGASNNFLTAVSAAGAISKAQPAFSNLSGSATCAQLPALTGTATTSAGSCATTLSFNPGLIEISLTGVNFNSANTDNPITITLPSGYTRYLVGTIFISHASASLTTATCGVFTAAAAGGTAIVTSGTAVAVSTASDATVNNSQSLTVNNTNQITYTTATLYFRVQTAQGSAATGDVTFQLRPMP